MKQIIKRAMKAWLTFKYRKYDDNVCCCGGYVSEGDYPSCAATCRSAKEYLITSELNRRND